MAGPGRKNHNIPRVDCDLMSTGATQNEARATDREAEHLVGVGVIVMEAVYAVAPLRRPAVTLERVLEGRSRIASFSRDGLAVEQHRQVRIVRHPTIGVQSQNFRHG